ncbi:MAG TPA: hypothetical protein VF303_03795 [Candidatus Nanoarchaeia archaeon]
MTKKIIIIALVLIVLVVLVCVVVAKLYHPKNNTNNTTSNNNVTQNINSNNEISSSQSEGSLGNHKCLSKFRVEKSVSYSGDPEILKLDFFQSFSSGAFFGKIKDYRPEQNKQFAAFMNQLMQEKKVTTYEHLRADVCLYNQDLLNPENGASLNYYVEHYYCTNHCQTGNYEIRVDLDAIGNFVGYRRGDNVY